MYDFPMIRMETKKTTHLFTLNGLPGSNSPTKLLKHDSHHLCCYHMIKLVKKEQSVLKILQLTRSVGTTTTALHWKPANGFIFRPRAVG